MSTVQIVPVQSPAEMKRFIALPAALFKSDPNYVPQLLIERSEAFSPKKNPYFQHAEVQFFLAVRGGRDVGRITAQVDQLTKDPAEGHFGCLAAIDDAEVFAALFAAAEGWLKAKGKTKVIGPFSLSINEETGLLIEGFDTPPMVFMAHDPRYAAARVEAQGYAKAKDVIAYLLDIRPDFLPKAARALIAKRKPKDMIVRNLDMKNYDEEFRKVTAIFNDAWSGNWGFIPFTEAEIAHMSKSLKPVIKPTWTAIVEYKGEPVAFGITLPNLNEIIRDFDGHLFPFNIVKLLWRIHKGTHTGRVPLLGVRRTLHAGMLGAMAPFLVIDKMADGARPAGLVDVELSWILEDNLPMRRVIESLGSKNYKTYRVYQKTLA